MPTTDILTEQPRQAHLRVVRDRELPPAPPLRWPLPNGETVTILHLGEETVVQLLGTDQRPIFRYDVNAGQLEIQGAIRGVKVSSSEHATTLESVGDICLRAEGRVRLQGKEGVELEATGDGAVARSRARVDPSGVHLEAHELGFLARHARFRIAHLQLAGETLRAAYHESQWAAERVELRAKHLRSKLHSVVQDVETSLVTRAGRVRTWISGTYHSKSQRVEIVAHEDVRIDGTTVNLG